MNEPKPAAVLLISHGSRSDKTKQEVIRLLNVVKKSSKIPIFHYAFLECEEPSIPSGIDQCVKDGAQEVIVLLNFLNSGRHVDEDIPKIVQAAKKKYPEIVFHVTPPVGQTYRMPELFLELINTIINDAQVPYDRQ